MEEVKPGFIIKDWDVLWFKIFAICERSAARFGIFFYQIRLEALRQHPYLKKLQRSEQEGTVRPDLSSFGNKECIYGHTGQTAVL